MNLWAALLLSLLITVLSGCTPFKRAEEVRNASSLVDFLYRDYEV